MNTLLRLRVFLSSPGDVSDERGQAREVLHNLAAEYAFLGKVLFEAIAWDDPGVPVALAANLTPQEGINRERPKPSDCDLVVVILWSRMGTPLPLEWRKPDGSNYRSGTEWEFLDAIHGAEQNSGRPLVWVYRKTEKILFDPDDPDFQLKIDQYQTVKNFFADFEGEGRSLHRSYHRYDSPNQFARLFEKQLREHLTKRLATLPPQSAQVQPTQVSESRIEPAEKPDWQGKNPYRGLDPFGPNDTAIFFGRGLETDELVKRVRDGVRVLAVVGASGSGKSSLVAAGLLPRLAKDAVNGSADWVQVRFTPAEKGENPFRALALALFSHLTGDQPAVDTFAQEFIDDPASIEKIAGMILTGKPKSAQLMLFADQFEELFTARVAENYRAPFVRLIETVANSRRVRLVLTLRADYYEHATRFSALAALLSDRSFSLAAPTGRALTEMIERPAQMAGLQLEPELVDDILREVGVSPGGLALMEFALEQLVDLCADGTLSRDRYHKALKGIAGAISQRANTAVADDAGNVDQDKLAPVFDALSEMDETGSAVRHRAWLDQFPLNAQALVQRLIKARVLTSDHDPETHRAWVEVAHEAVLREWDLFKQWLSNYLAFKLWRERLKVKEREWREANHDKDLLLRGSKLLVAEEYLKAHEVVLKQREIDFIQESIRLRIKETSDKIKFRRRVVIGLLAFSISVSILAGLFLFQKQRAEDERNEANRQNQIAIKAVKALSDSFGLSKSLDATKNTPDTNTLDILKQLEPLYSLEEDSDEILGSKARTFNGLADTYNEFNSNPQAIIMYDAALKISRALVQKSSDNTKAKVQLAHSLGGLIMPLIKNNEINNALKYFDEAFKITKDLKKDEKAAEVIDIHTCPSDNRDETLKMLADKRCPCGCIRTVAHCLVTDFSCSTSKNIAKNIMKLQQCGADKEQVPTLQ